MPDCRNCGNSIAAIARFCAFCGAPQHASQPEPGETVSAASTPVRAFESDVTVILPRRRANVTLPPAAHNDESAASTPAAPAYLRATPAAHRSRATALKIGGAAAIAIVAAFAAVAYYATRVTSPAGKPDAPVVTVTTPVAAPVPAAARSVEPDAASKAEAPSIPAVETVIPVKVAPLAEAPMAPEPAPPASASPKIAPAKDAASRKRARAPVAPVAEPSPVEAPPPQPVAVAPPPPVTAPPPEPVKVEKVACADSSNPFSREACLWQECAKPEFRSHAECARFTGPGGQK